MCNKLPLILLLSLVTIILPSTLLAEKITFDQKYSLVFPEGWKKSESPEKNAIIFRESAAGDASFAVVKLELPKNSRADVAATVEAMLAGMKAKMKPEEEPKITPGKIDGKKSVFAKMMSKVDGVQVGFYLVAIDARDRVFILQATIPSSASNKTRQDCMAIINSFKEERK